MRTLMPCAGPGFGVRGPSKYVDPQGKLLITFMSHLAACPILAGWLHLTLVLQVREPSNYLDPGGKLSSSSQLKLLYIQEHPYLGRFAAPHPAGPIKLAGLSRRQVTSSQLLV